MLGSNLNSVEEGILKLYVECVSIYAYNEKSNITGNTGSPFWGLTVRLVIMSYLQNGPKRPASDNFDVACKVGCTISTGNHTSRRDESFITFK